MVTNNLWTLAQQYYLYEKMAKEDDAAALQRREDQKSLAPKVGVKQVNPKKGRAVVGSSPVAPGAEARTEGSTVTAEAKDRGVHEPASGPAPGAQPRPGQRPQAPGGQRSRPAQKAQGSKGKKKKKKR